MGGRIGNGVNRQTSSPSNIRNRDSSPDEVTSQREISSLKESAAEELASKDREQSMRVLSSEQINNSKENVEIQRGILEDDQGEYSVYFAVDKRNGKVIENAGFILDGKKTNFQINESAEATYKAAEISDRKLK